MRTLRHLPHYTIADYEHWEGDWELINGIPFSTRSSQIKTRPTRVYSKVLAALTRTIGNELNSSSESNCELLVQLDWPIDDHNVLRPDLSISHNDTGDYISSAPVLIIEILTPYTALVKRKVKLNIYESAGVPYYIIINPETAQYEIHVLKDGKYIMDNHIQAFEFPEGCTLTLDLAKVLEELA